ncbi:MAG: carbohydrate porin [Myxococcaceae bacterium]
MALATLVLVSSPSTEAQDAASAADDGQTFSVMGLLAQHGLHDIHNESWNLYGQFTYISSVHPSFSAPYTNANGSINSLLPDAEWSFTGTFTLFFGLRLWPGGEGYLVPEIISEQPFSGLKGIGGAIQNFELQKTGGVTPSLYHSRIYLRQTIELGGSEIVRPSGIMSLGTVVDSRRIVLTLGNFSYLDVFDRNNVAFDPRQTFLNMAFMTYAAWDFAADARGYSYGGTAELYWDDWVLRFGRMAPPQNPNQLPINFHIWQYYGDALELEHDHVLFGQPGVIRILGYRNFEVIGNFSDAIDAFKANPAQNAANCGTNFNYGSGNFNAPDLCWVRKPNQKLGIGVSIEQFVARDIGIFLRAMYADGQSEVDAFDPADRSFTIGAIARGSWWGRPLDLTGVGFGMSWISSIHAQYLAMGGVDAFVGDGLLQHAGGEGIVEIFYSVNFFKAIWLTGDYQFLWHPGFNVARGPVDIFGVRVHAEF